MDSPKMDGENHGKPYFLMDDLGVPLFLETPKCTWSMVEKKLNGRKQSSFRGQLTDQTDLAAIWSHS